MKEIDARGLACPAPVLQIKAALKKEKAGRRDDQYDGYRHRHATGRQGHQHLTEN